ncbi:hypothetical protein RvY_07850 [Ramazzottius varieornatus]|uniref:Uncharacterized protein n=1 Tax=Ramazzottius varieornatus TaxID=947166 RepID=A0A1D1VD15_RAMVA|nr:hypothetical protein RvY_07850 [Ramazzottius varieornatus]
MEDRRSMSDVKRSVIVSIQSSPSPPSPILSPKTPVEHSNGNGLSSVAPRSVNNQAVLQQQQQQQQQQQAPRKYPVGIPLSAPTTCYTAPVHIDVGGIIYTSSLETLTKFPESRLAKLFNGNIPIVLDSLKQHYFLDRDGRMFRHVLNYVRHGRLMVPKTFQEWALLYEEAKWFSVPGMVQDIEEHLERKPVEPDEELESPRPAKRSRKVSLSNGRNTFATTAPPADNRSTTPEVTFSNHDCVTILITPDLGERITLTSERSIAEEVFPEISDALSTNGRGHATWNTDLNHLARFPLNGYCKLNSIQVIQRLLNSGFKIAASNGGGIESQHFTEYLFTRAVRTS